MKNKILVKQRIKKMVIFYLIAFVFLECLVAYLAFGTDVEERVQGAIKIVLCVFPTVIPASLYVLFDDYLSLSDEGVTHYRYIRVKKQGILWRGVSSIQVEERPLNKAMIKFIVIKDVNNNEITYLYEEKNLQEIISVYETKKTDNLL